jgi:cell division protein ZapA
LSQKRSSDRDDGLCSKRFDQFGGQCYAARVKRSVTVNIGRQQFSLRTDANPSYVKELAAYVDQKLSDARQSGRTITTQSLALLAAMSIADELHQLRASHEALKRKVREKSKRILRSLDPEA